MGKQVRVFIAQVAMHGIVLLLAWFCVPAERVAPVTPTSRQAGASVSITTSACSKLKHTLVTLQKNCSTSYRESIRALILIELMLVAFTYDSFHELAAMYAKDEFGWSTPHIGEFLSISGCGGVVSTLIVLPLVVKCCGATIALVMGCIPLVLASVAACTAGSTIFFCSGFVMNLGIMVKTACTAIISMMVPPEEQGAVMGIVGMQNELGGLVSPLAIGYAERYYGYLPQPFDKRSSPFILIGLSTMVASILSVIIWQKQRSQLRVTGFCHDHLTTLPIAGAIERVVD